MSPGYLSDVSNHWYSMPTPILFKPTPIRLLHFDWNWLSKSPVTATWLYAMAKSQSSSHSTYQAALDQVDSFFLRHVLHLILRTPLLVFLLSVSSLVLFLPLTSECYWTLRLCPWSSPLTKLTPLVISHGFKYYLCDVNSQVTKKFQSESLF